MAPAHLELDDLYDCDPPAPMSTTDEPNSKRPQASSRILGWTTWSLTTVVIISLSAGIAAALFGGILTDLGSGAGGLFGIPSILTTLIALFLAIPAAIVTARQTRQSPGWLRSATVIATGAWVVAIGYFVVAHAVDPCVNGWWGPQSRLGDQPLCERFGPELNWHTRFHLLAHALPAAILLAMYLYAIRRWASFPAAWKPEDAPTKS